ncbi:Tyrosinase central domain-containing protein [Mycena venus]|uniref:Tyrosinase central domain-containing protein n=1 Tax=Mycena venus TaxID=2733690 RepID=A0A8H7CZW3_9AGAR|nr:Tyrosinase central domain-containing protein [Mycena venus]
MTSGGKLPVELERLAFEYAAETRSEIPNLILVAQRVRVWLEPLLYTVLQLSSPHLAATVLKSLETKPAQFLASTVRHVLVYASTDTLDPEAFERFLTSCPGIVTLSITGSITGPNLLPALGNMRIQRLSVDLGELFFRYQCEVEEEKEEEFGVNLDHPLFATVSHLDIMDDSDIEDSELEGQEWLQNLSTLPALTNLAFSTTPNPHIVHSILGSCPRLRVLVVLFSVSDTAGARAYLQEVINEVSITDMRFVVATYADYYADWELGARGKEDIWVRVEEFVARKRRGEVEASDYFLNGSPADESDESD